MTTNMTKQQVAEAEAYRALTDREQRAREALARAEGAEDALRAAWQETRQDVPAIDADGYDGLALDQGDARLLARLRAAEAAKWEAVEAHRIASAAVDDWNDRH